MILKKSKRINWSAWHKIILDDHIGKPKVKKFNKEAKSIDYFSTIGITSKIKHMEGSKRGG